MITLNLHRIRSASIYNIDKYIKYLINGEFIIRENINDKGTTKPAYKINEKYLGGVYVVNIEPETKLFDKIIKKQRNRKAHFNRLAPHLQQMKDKFMNMDFDYTGAEDWIKSNLSVEKQYYAMVAISQLEDKRFRNFHRNETNNRLDTNLTNLKSDLKQFLIGDYAQIDVKNSQPFLLSYLIQTITTNNTILFSCINGVLDVVKVFGNKTIKKVLKIHHNAKKADLVNLSSYFESVKNGRLYEDFIELTPDDITRDEAKDAMFALMFSQNEIHKGHRRFIPYKKEKEIFASAYPLLYEMIKVLKEKDHTKLSVTLQKIESHLFIDRIAKELVENGIVPLTVHDSVIVERQHADKALQIMKHVFETEIGFVPSFHIDSLKPINKKTTRWIN